ncbi:UBC-like protein [Cryphonectria parasitica EP155]|uniref:UBC-like protein n=1 Tax=Cryphonectria parasitica (strain ATCC 38755 / EP155) TaxID=660469 RepID=A0A9P5CKM1_CRYP1|nr:UBC-like protein [Cryphonectria parasitica EP155]KAF3762394.1 UBC-like protein [Cryphonectria parasitica EP155]
MADQSIIRITKELGDLQKNADLSLAVACRDADVRNIRAVIIGPHETPYEFGFFEFTFRFGKEYPRKAPSVTAITTNGGRCRFNPNIYAGGRVCLTWRGEPGEEWSAAQGLESILLSIQSLMSSNPYENEPGFEDARETQDKKNQKDYVQKIQHESLRISVIQRLEGYLGIGADGNVTPPVAAQDEYDPDFDGADEGMTTFEPFKDLFKRRFLWYYESYLAAIHKASKDVKEGQAFARMPFEGGGNQMDGKFHYGELEKRLRNIKRVLDEEPLIWAAQGKEVEQQEETVAVNLKRQLAQVSENYKQHGIPHNVEAEDGNPFVWIFTYFGRPMTNMDGGLFRIRIHLSPKFPEEQPRIRFETKLFHQRIAPDGTPCCWPPPSKRENMQAHLDAIIEMLEEEHPPYDPRTLVHPEAFKLFWGNEKEKKQYRQRLRRSVQASVE